MNFIEQLQEDLALAQRIKDMAADSSVSADAIFTAIRATPLAKRNPPELGDPPEWFATALETLKGRKLNVGQFMLLSGQFPVTKTQRNAVAKWLRASGRHLRSSGGERLYCI